MRHRSISIGMGASGLAWLALGLLPAQAAQVQKQVTLFDHTCKMFGPSITAIDQAHAITPGNLFPLDTPEKVHKAQEILNTNPTVPDAFKLYRSKLKAYLSALETFFDRSKEAAEKHQAKVFIDGVQRFIVRNRKTLIQKSEFLNQKLDAKKRTPLIVELLETYKESIDPNPEIEFHRALKEMKMRYECDFDQVRSQGSDEGDEDDSPEAED